MTSVRLFSTYKSIKQFQTAAIKKKKKKNVYYKFSLSRISLRMTVKCSIADISAPGTDLRPCINQGTKQDCCTTGERKITALKGDMERWLPSLFAVKMLGLEVVVLLQIGQIS